MLVTLVLAASCLPQQTAVRDLSSSDISDGETSDDNSFTNDEITSGISETNFFQQAASRTTGAVNLYSDFKDSFLLRGDNIHNYIKDNIAGTSKKLCMAVNYPLSSDKKVFVMGARPRSFYNSVLKGKEHYLQMEAANENANVNDCLSVNISSAATNAFGSSSLAFTIGDVCPTCSGTLASASVKLFLSSGAEPDQVVLGNLGLNIIPASNANPGGGLTCSTDATCKVQGFDCCLQSQCVNHGETKPGQDTTSTEYLSALEQVLARPQTIDNYTQYFYVCPELIPGDTSSGDDTQIDPAQQADDLLTELHDLYRCVNPVIDEFGLCPEEAPIDLEKIGSGGTTVSAKASDLTFSNLNPLLSFNNIAEVEYAGQTVYRQKVLDSDLEMSQDAYTAFSSPNDDIQTGQSVTVDKTLPPDASRSTLKILYRTDATCERLGASLAKCQKYYVQGQDSAPYPRSSDHPSGNNVFKLPAYANFNYNIIVELGGVKVPPGADTWTANSLSKQIEFSDPVANNQRLTITYFVTNAVIDGFQFKVDDLLAGKEAAQERVDLHCKCDEEAGCNLKPVYDTVNGENKLVSYICEYGQPDTPEAPLQETVYLSAKSVPHRYFDQDGVPYELEEIGDAQAQEGTEFRYESDNPLRPNNQSQYIGFNEIYGSFARTEISAMPAAVVEIEKGTQYDIFVDDGVFSSCLDCGTDYFSNLQKLFPGSFEHKGGGYFPDMVESRLKLNRGKHSGMSDMKFGRACFVPATMIPWTHRSNSDVVKQRRDRLAAQHFLFANGYNKDWYGFDYGSLIGSFDGVRWFSIGNQRRVQAKSNKLYLAINAYFGDLTINNSFKITVSELSTVFNSGSAITHDTESDGAQCQKAHFCETDNDCVSQLGYEYTCQSVSGVMTPWPVFDSNGNELEGSAQVSLLSLVGGSNGQVKRCVYRGRGSLCEKDLAAVTSVNSYLSSDNPALHACSPNTYCAGLEESKFNNRIARYGRSPANQNNQSYITNQVGKSDTFGLEARFIGRPFDFYGNKPVAPGVRSSLQSAKARAMCVPGKNPMGMPDVAALNTHSGGAIEADTSLDIGKTFPEYVTQNKAYFAACPATDDNDSFTHNNKGLLGQALTDHNSGRHSVFASAQNMSTNSMNNNAFDDLGLFNDDAALKTSAGYNKAACLRAPGSSCFSDMDCSPNSFISSRVKSLSNLEDVFSVAEKNFWEEELVCANSQDRYIAGSLFPNPVYKLNEHKCCRETGKDFSFATQMHLESEFKVVAGDDPSGEILLPGINQSINSPDRYSRTHTVYDKLINERHKYPPLYAPGKERAAKVNFDTLSELLQYNTLHLNNTRMCCTGHWVRNFATGTNGNNGGHKFTGQSQQNINIENFEYLNWSANNVPAINDFDGYDPAPYTCNAQDFLTADCEIKNIPEGGAEEKQWLAWFEKFELLGIPQVLIETNEEFSRPLNEDQETDTSETPLEGTVKKKGSGGIADARYETKDYYTAASYDNFDIGSGKLKKVFSEDSFSCCIPTGVEVDGGMPESNCCSGQINTEEDEVTGNPVSRCCLNDFADLSVYTNRYVSSEGAYINGQPISDSDIDPETGYIKKEIVMQLAPTMCCSGRAMYGFALGEFLIPGAPQNSAKTRRWISRADLDNADEVGNAVDKFNAGLKWNNHVYCVPSDSDSGSSDGGGGGAVQN